MVPIIIEEVDKVAELSARLDSLEMLIVSGAVLYGICMFTMIQFQILDFILNIVNMRKNKNKESK